MPKLKVDRNLEPYIELPDPFFYEGENYGQILVNFIDQAKEHGLILKKHTSSDSCWRIAINKPNKK